MSDIDLLVDEVELEHAARHVLEIGFEEDINGATHHLRFARSTPARLSLEIHIDLMDRPHGLHLTPQRRLSRASVAPIGVDDVEARVLHPVDATLLTILHGAYAETLCPKVTVFRTALDLAWMTHTFALDGASTSKALWAEGARWGLEPAMLATLELTSELFDGIADSIIATAPTLRGIRNRMGYRQLLRNARRALSGTSERNLPSATLTRALLAPTSRGAVQMITNGLTVYRARKDTGGQVYSATSPQNLRRIARLVGRNLRSLAR